MANRITPGCLELKVYHWGDVNPKAVGMLKPAIHECEYVFPVSESPIDSPNIRVFDDPSFAVAIVSFDWE